MAIPIFSISRRLIYSNPENHPFIDGNKRTGLAAADLFLYFNGYSLEAEQEDVIQLVLMVTTSEIDETGAAAFFRDHAVVINED